MTPWGAGGAEDRLPRAATGVCADCSAEGEESWKVVSRRCGRSWRKGRVLRPGPPCFHSPPDAAQPHQLPSPASRAAEAETRSKQALALAERIRAFVPEVEKSALWTEVKSRLRDALSSEVSLLRRESGRNAAGFSSEEEDIRRVRFSLRCLGLGSPTQSADTRSSRLQLAAALSLRRLFKIPSSRVSVLEPALSPLDCEALESLGLPVKDAFRQELASVHSDSEERSTPEAASAFRGIIEVSIVFAPHCDADLYGDLLSRELRLKKLCKNCLLAAAPRTPEEFAKTPRSRRGFVLFGNQLSHYEDRRHLFGDVSLLAVSDVNAGRRERATGLLGCCALCLESVQEGLRLARGAHLLLLLLPHAIEAPLTEAFPLHLPAFNDLAVTRFESPRTLAETRAFWSPLLQAREAASRAFGEDERSEALP